MIRIKADYHTHTHYSDGKGTVLDNVRAAHKKGLGTLAISDHSWGHGIFGLKREQKNQYFKDIEEAGKIFPDMKILKGIECNILGPDGAIDLTPEEMEEFDLVLCGYHFGSRIRSYKDLCLHGANALHKFTGLGEKRTRKVNTRALLRAMDYPIDVLTHPGDKGPVDIVAVAEKAALKGIKLEINQRHKHLSLEQLNQIKDLDLEYILSSDAHRPEDIGEVEKAYGNIIASGLDPKKIVNLKEVL
ncbi:MAG TPA: PHP domain-containing protein [Clostridia bacterium]|nr:PHP domain-containing protein [Clostridia bacterium]